jgi:Fe-S-cluster-containing dehydrogenase component/DMSO reductase anchor subunit
MPAVERFAQWHDKNHDLSGHYSKLLPTAKPKQGQQYAFEVNLDSCTGCKACVVACHSLNGLEDHESWRSTGSLISTDWREPKRQTVTTACHHCVDPACANGCPTLAYDKNAETGIVRHLDDQCIGCSYCTMTCPYEVPQYEPKRGIVRKCDMCRQRLDVGEAPACVQSCPNGAIKIVLVDKTDIVQQTRASTLLPTAPSSSITAPTTRYVSSKPLPQRMASDLSELKPQHTHWPLVLMLLLTQWGVGCVVAAWLLQNQLLAVAGAAIGFAGTGAATLHLGRPLQAWRAWLGWRKSWLSREILVFGAHGPLAGTYAASFFIPQIPLATWVGAAAAVTGVLGVICSGMLYHATRRVWWRAGRSVGRFILTTAVLGCASALLLVPGFSAVWLVAATLLKLTAESRWLLCDDTSLADEPAPAAAHLQNWSLARSVRLLDTRLALPNRLRFLLTFVGVFILPFSSVSGAVALMLFISAELLERMLFFQAAAPPQMPGWKLTH